MAVKIISYYKAVIGGVCTFRLRRRGKKEREIATAPPLSQNKHQFLWEEKKVEVDSGV